MDLAHDEARIGTLRRDWASGGLTVGLVPTMGALHQGHLSLVRKARELCDRLVVSIFVNPSQFAPGEDLSRYPRDLLGDCELLEKESVDVVFAPGPETMYPEGYATHVEVARLTSGLCGASRPGHFRGVTTVCCLLFNIVGPDLAVFGEKDYQQLVVIRRMVSDLRLKLRIVSCPIVREDDGLAMSSRNAYLTREERAQAVFLHRGLRAAANAAEDGEIRVEGLRSAFKGVLLEAPLLNLSYIEAVHPDTLEPAELLDRPLRLLAAVHVGSTRLIDNLALEPPHQSRRI